MIKLATIALLFTAAALPAASTTRVRFEVTQTTTFGTSVFVLGNDPLLGNNDITRALKLHPGSYPVWSAGVELPSGKEISYRYLSRLDAAAELSKTTNGTFISPSPLTLTVPGAAAPPATRTIRYFSSIANPVFQVLNLDGTTYTTAPMQDDGPGRGGAERRWLATVGGLPPRTDWQFRIDLGGGNFDVPSDAPRYTTSLDRLWLQDGQIYNYTPPATVSAPRVVKIASFTGSLSTRPLYIYLPRGYDQNTTKRYPVMYMHDGQNCFQAYVADSGFGSWKADEMATRLIRQGRMRESIIVGVSHGGSNRIPEYLPPYASYLGTTGRADQTVTYYRNSVAPYVNLNYRTLTDRDNTALCGSSMGGLFTTYFAWEFTSFARHHASVSPAYWITSLTGGTIESTNRLRTGTPRDIRMWLDSGTIDSFGQGVSGGDDGMQDTVEARDAMLQNSYAMGPDLMHFVDYGAAHSESSWSLRLDKIFLFLFPTSQEAAPETGWQFD